MPNPASQMPRTELGRTKAAGTRIKLAGPKPRTRLDWAIIASILLMLAVNAIALFGDLGPATAYAAVPM